MTRSALALSPSRRVARAAAALALLLATGLGCEGRAPAPSSDPGGDAPARPGEPALVEIDLSRGLPEAMPPVLFGAPQRRAHLDLVRALRKATEAETTRGLLVRLGTSSVALTRAIEVGGLLARVRDAGKPVVCHADELDNAALAVVSGCSRVWLSPAGGVDAVGIAAQLVFAKRLLERFDLDADFLQVGRFKGASEPFTRDEASPEARQSLEGTLRGLRAGWITAATAGREPAAAEALTKAMEDGPYGADEAKRLGFVHEVGFLEDAREEGKKLADTRSVVSRFGASEPPGLSGALLDVLRSISGADSVGTPRVVVLPALGAISMSGSSFPLGADGITERDLGRAIRKLTEDDSVKAVVLRIDSPGGSALASDLLWKQLMLLREKKPLVVSVGGMAASGGYYLACAGTRILAGSTSIVGSIGVVAGKVSFGRALADIGISVETVAASPDPEKAARAAYLSPLVSWDEPTKKRVLQSMTSVYDLFLSRIVESRGLELADVARSAEGRIFAGTEALERKLVDELGGFDDAVRVALELGKLPADAPVEVERGRTGIFDLLDPGEVEGDARASAAMSAEVSARVARAVRDALVPAWLAPEIAVSIAVVMPLLEGERFLAAAPYALVVR